MRRWSNECMEQQGSANNSNQNRIECHVGSHFLIFHLISHWYLYSVRSKTSMFIILADHTQGYRVLSSPLPIWFGLIHQKKPLKTCATVNFLKKNTHVTRWFGTHFEAIPCGLHSRRKALRHMYHNCKVGPGKPVKNGVLYKPYKLPYKWISLGLVHRTYRSDNPMYN